MNNNFQLKLNIKSSVILIIALLLAGLYPHISFSQNYENANPRFYWKQGTKLVDVGQYDEAIDNFSKAIKFNKGEITAENIANIYNSRGLIYIRKKQYKEAINDFNSALKINSKKPEVYTSLGSVY